MTAITGVHPYADRFPMLPDDELAELVASIAANGLRNPVVVTPDGLILDGRNRFSACRALGFDPETVVYEGTDLAEYVIDCNTTRRHLKTGQRAMASALVLADDGRREGGRWDYRSQMLPGQQSESSTWRVSMMRAGVILDYAPELAAAVISGETPLKTAFTAADERRRSAEADELARKAAEKRARVEAKTAAERDAKIVADLSALGHADKYLALIDSGTLTPTAAWGAYLADTEKERRAARDRDNARSHELRVIQESVRYLSGGAAAAAIFLADTYPQQGRLSPQGMHITHASLAEAREYITTLMEAIR